jgi:hypothetical protein
MIIDKYIGNAEYTTRSAELCKDQENNLYYVNLYNDNRLVETRSLTGKSIYYARDCAENWVTGVING